MMLLGLKALGYPGEEQGCAPWPPDQITAPALASLATPQSAPDTNTVLWQLKETWGWLQEG